MTSSDISHENSAIYNNRNHSNICHCTYNNVTMSLEDMYGWSDTSSTPYSTYTNFVTSGHKLTISSSAEQLKFAVPFQFGFDGLYFFI